MLTRQLQLGAANVDWESLTLGPTESEVEAVQEQIDALTRLLEPMTLSDLAKDLEEAKAEEVPAAAVADSAETEAFEISDADIEDEPQQQVTIAGATADPVKDYLKQIGKVALLNAEQEVQLAKRSRPGCSRRRS